MWRDECAAKHSRCPSHTQRSGWNPTRLLQLGDQGDIRLVHPQTQAPIHYIALSHRWSSDPSLTLTWDNLESFEQSIPINQAPLSFIGVFNLAKELGFQYIWIDSLCIIQGPDISDWKRESLQMHNIYGQADLTVSLTGLKDSETSIRQARCSKYAKSTCLDEHWVIHEPRDVVWSDLVLNAPLSSRGWALQERLLSRRILHLGGKQMAWECRTSEAMETYPGLSTSPNNSGVARFWDAIRSGNRSDYWCKLVEEYTRRDLTDPGDILRAIDGVASVMSGEDRVQYLTGMWRQTVARELAWTREPQARFRNPPHPVENYASTWSWASVRGPVKFPSTSQNFGLESGLSETSGLTYIPLTELVATLPESNTFILDNMEDPGVVKTIFLEGWTCPLGFSDVNPDGTMENMTLRSESVDEQVFKVMGVLDTHIPRPALWEIGRNEKAVFVPTIRTRTDLIGIILVSLMDEPQIYIRVGSLELETRSNTESVFSNASQPGQTPPSPALAKVLAVCTESRVFDGSKEQWVRLPLAKQQIAIQV